MYAVFTSSEIFDASFDSKAGTVGSGLVTQLHMLLQRCLLRRLKCDVEKGLPPKTETKIFLPLSPMQARASHLPAATRVHTSSEMCPRHCPICMAIDRMVPQGSDARPASVGRWPRLWRIDNCAKCSGAFCALLCPNARAPSRLITGMLRAVFELGR